MIHLFYVNLTASYERPPLQSSSHYSLNLEARSQAKFWTAFKAALYQLGVNKDMALSGG